MNGEIHIYKCPTCPEEFMTRRELRKHLIKKHSIPEKFLHEVKD